MERKLSSVVPHTVSLCCSIRYSCGANTYGQLGLGTKTDAHEPSLVPLASSSRFAGETGLMDDVVHIACGPLHSAAVTADGRAFTWGYGRYGQLGQGDRKNYAQATRIQSILPASFLTHVTGSDAPRFFPDPRPQYSASMKARAKEVGAEVTAPVGSFGQILARRKSTMGATYGVRSVACGERHTLFLRVRTVVWRERWWACLVGVLTRVSEQDDCLAVLGCGDNEFGQLGTGTTTRHLVPTVATGLEFIATSGELTLLRTVHGGHCVHSRKNYLSHFADQKLTKIAAGRLMSAVVSETGNLYAWGTASIPAFGMSMHQPWLQPRLVQSLVGAQVRDVCCGGFKIGLITGTQWGCRFPVTVFMPHCASRGVLQSNKSRCYQTATSLGPSCLSIHLGVLDGHHLFGDHRGRRVRPSSGGSKQYRETHSQTHRHLLHRRLTSQAKGWAPKHPTCPRASRVGVMAPPVSVLAPRQHTCGQA